MRNTSTSTVEAGEWVVHEAQPIEIPAIAGFHNGVWFRIRQGIIRQGIKGLIVEADEVRDAYMLAEPASYYYKIRTRAERMPVLIGERIQRRRR